MRIKRSLVLVFFLLLYIGPVIFISSHGHTATEPNMIKDFHIATDPWYDESYQRRQNITITGSAGAGTNYQVNITVPYDGSMQADFDDILFTDDDGVTLLDHWKEDYTASTSAVFWVEVADDLGSNQYIWMYYWNSTAIDASDGTATFLMYEDWSSESIEAATWDTQDSGGSIGWEAADANHGKVAHFMSDPADTWRLTSDYTTPAPFVVMFRSNIEESSAGNTGRQGAGYDSFFSFAFVQTSLGTNTFNVYDDDANQDAQAMTSAYFDTWVTFQVTRDSTSANLYADTVLIETASCDPDVNTNPAIMIMDTDSEDDLYSDWVAVRKFITTEPAFASFGAEEGGDWYEVGEATLYFSVPFDYWALNMFLVFGGLVLMLVGASLMAVKVRDRTVTRDSGILFLFLFCVGWGLFIGGTLIG